MKTTQIILLTLAAAGAFALPAVAQDTPPSAPKPQGPGVPPLVALFDKNKDGKLDASEIDGAAAALRSLDKDNNGEIAKEEFPRPEARRPNRRGPGGPEARGDGRRPDFDNHGPGRPGPRGEDFRRDERRPNRADRDDRRPDDRRRGPESFGRFDNRRDDRRDSHGGQRDFRRDDRRPNDGGPGPRRDDYRRDDRGFHGPDRDARRFDDRRPEGRGRFDGDQKYRHDGRGGQEFRRDNDRGPRGNFGPENRRDFHRPGGDWNRPQGERGPDRDHDRRPDHGPNRDHDRGPDRGPHTGDNQVIEANEIVSAE